MSDKVGEEVRWAFALAREVLEDLSTAESVIAAATMILHRTDVDYEKSEIEIQKEERARLGAYATQRK